MALDKHAWCSLVTRLHAAGVEPGADPVAAWTRLRSVEGPRATIIDLYQLAGQHRGLAADELPLPERVGLARAVQPTIWPEFAVTTGSDRYDEIILADPDPRWPDQYERWRQRVTAALGSVARRVEHVGSTSVPGLRAKQIIDVQISVSDIHHEHRYVPQLETVGVQLRSRDEFHRYFRPAATRPRDVHIHVCAAGGEWERDHLLFRDYLRTHAVACAAYTAAKTTAAEQWHDDRFAYNDAKSEAILTILDHAEQWATASDWTPNT